MSKILDECLDAKNAETHRQVNQIIEKFYFEHHLSVIREKLSFSQEQIAKLLDIKQSSVSAIEKLGDDIKISTLKRYLEAIGCTMKIDIKLPNGESIEFNV